MYLDQSRQNRIGCIGLAFPHCAFSSASSSFLFDTVHTCNGCICLCALKFLGSEMQDHIVGICENFPYCVYSDVHLNGMHARLHVCSHCLHLFVFSQLCIFGYPNNIRIRSFLENRIIFVFVFGPFWKAE